MRQAERVADSSLDTHLAGNWLANSVDKPRIDRRENFGGYCAVDIPIGHLDLLFRSVARGTVRIGEENTGILYCVKWNSGKLYHEIVIVRDGTFIPPQPLVTSTAKFMVDSGRNSVQNRE